jgi:uncharacterized membrane protein
MWVFPMLSTLAAIGAFRVLHWIERNAGWVSPIDPDTGRLVLGTMASALFTAIIFICSALLVAVQLASAQLTPRIIGIVFRDPVAKLSLTLLAFTFTFTLAALIRITSDVPPLTAHLAAYDCLVSLGIFFFLIDHLGQALRPSGALRVIAKKGRKVPAINDPTTAVLALDEIHHLLRDVGNRYLDTGHVRDASGRLRLVYRTPDWEDFVRLAVTEIRHFGGESIQVTRRLRAMLENLIQTVPEPRGALLRQELSLLHRSAERFFAEPEDRVLADVSDLQGVGGKCLPGEGRR